MNPCRNLDMELSRPFRPLASPTRTPDRDHDLNLLAGVPQRKLQRRPNFASLLPNTSLALNLTRKQVWPRWPVPGR